MVGTNNNSVNFFQSFIESRSRGQDLSDWKMTVKRWLPGWMLTWSLLWCEFMYSLMTVKIFLVNNRKKVIFSVSSRSIWSLSMSVSKCEAGHNSDKWWESENYQMQRIFLWSHKYLDVISGPILKILHLEKESLYFMLFVYFYLRWFRYSGITVLWPHFIRKVTFDPRVNTFWQVVLR